jgi:hypothetical protein
MGEALMCSLIESKKAGAGGGPACSAKIAGKPAKYTRSDSLPQGFDAAE